MIAILRFCDRRVSPRISHTVSVSYEWGAEITDRQYAELNRDVHIYLYEYLEPKVNWLQHTVRAIMLHPNNSHTGGPFRTNSNVWQNYVETSRRDGAPANLELLVLIYHKRASDEAFDSIVLL